MGDEHVASVFYSPEVGIACAEGLGFLDGEDVNIGVEGMCKQCVYGVGEGSVRVPRQDF